MNTTSETLAQSARPIFRLVERTRRLLRLSLVATGTGATVGAFLGTLVAAAAIDLLFPLDTTGRLIALLAVLIVTGIAYVTTVVRPVARPMTPSHVARRIESQLPGIRNRLVSCIELLSGEMALAGPVSEAFEQRLVGETNERLGGFDPKRIIDWPHLQRAAVLGLAALLVFGGLVLVIPQRMAITLKRIVAPLADIPPAAHVRYRVEPGDAQILRGEGLTLAAHVDRGMPDTLKVEIRNLAGDDAPIWHDLVAGESNSWVFALAGYEQPFRYRVVGGGTWSRTYTVEVLERPTIVELHTVLHYPDYLAFEPATGETQVAEVAGPEGSVIEVVSTVQGDVDVGEIQRMTSVSNQFTVAQGAQPMQVLSNQVWHGKFQLGTNGFYRVEFRNRLGHANKPMTPAAFTVIPDGPPQITFERPGTNVRLGPGEKLPVAVAVSDDFALEAVLLLVQLKAGAEIKPYPLKEYPAVVTADTVLSTLDLPALGAKAGDQVRYRAQVRDRKGQTTTTEEFMVHIGNPAESTTQGLAKVSEQQDGAVQQLTALIAAQDTVRAELEGLTTRYAPLLEKIETAVTAAELQPAPETAPATESLSETNLAVTAAALSLETVEANQLEGLRVRLEELAQKQTANLQQAQQIAENLKQAADMAAANPLMPDVMADQLRALQQAFEGVTTEPMQGLATALQQAAQPSQLPTAAGQLGEISDQLQQDLAGMSESLQDLAEATWQVPDDPASALAELEEARQRTAARLTARELGQLNSQLDQVMGELDRLQGDQQQLFEQAVQPDAGEPLTAAVEQQLALENELRPLLEAVQQLQADQQLRRMEPPPTFPDAPYTPDHGGYEVPPKEEDTPEPPVEGEPAEQLTHEERVAQLKEQLERRLAELEAGIEEADEPLYQPALGGERPELSERFADDRRPVTRPTEVGLPLAGERERLQEHQWERLQELDLARQSVSADQQALNALTGQLEQALGAPGQPPGQAPGQGGPLQQALQSTSLQRAMQMASQMQAMQGMPGMPGQPASAAAGSAAPSTGLAALFGGWSAYGGGMRYAGPVPEGELPNLDVNSRAVILGMQPKLREELLQGLREEGPAAYRVMIQNYFKELTKVGGK